jgi:ATP-binding cassette, subfamily F, member 3
MLLLSCSELLKGFDEGPLFEGLGFELFHGDRVGLVGPNGVGKTTLLRLIAGLDQPDRGEVRLHAGARIALLEQQPRFEPGRSLIDEARSALDELTAAHDDMVRTGEELAKATEEATRKRLSARFDRLTELLHHHDAYNVDHHVEAVIDGLGFRPEDYDRSVGTFSGGQQSRLMLAKLLLAAPDVMLLDEPSNHLDIAGTEWLEEYLSKQNEAMLIVSHDRTFLDRVVTKIFELHAGKLTSYPGNYTAYNRQRQERYNLALKTWEAQQEYIGKQEEYIRRVHYGVLHKQAASRQAALDRLERVERPTLIEGPKMHFRPVRRSGDVVFEVHDLAKAYDKPLFSDLSFQVQRGQRLGIVGPNGSGKTTLLRMLLSQEQPDKGEVRRGHLVDIGYYDQQLQNLPDDQEAIRAVWPDDPAIEEQQMRDLLARFGITGDQAYQKVGNLSGGERSRVAIAKLVAKNVNLLILDEPTNHLDLWACESLEEALQAFEGTVIVVTHDRTFLNKVVNLLVVLDGQGGARVVSGNYETYELMHRGSGSGVRGPAKSAGPTKSLRGPEPRTPAPESSKRRRRFPYRKVEDLESDIAGEEARLRELEALMASPDLYRDGERVKQTTAAFEETKVKIAQLYEHWEEAVELNQR